MANDTALQIAQAVARETDEAAITSIVTPTKNSVANILAWMNEGYELVWSKAWKNESAEIHSTITVNASTYDFSAVNIHHFKSLWITGFKPIDVMDYDRFITEYPNDGSVTGQPIRASYDAKKIYFWPIPEQSYTLNYTAKASFTKLTTDAGIPIVDSNCIKEYAKYKQFSRDGNTTAAQIAYMDFERLTKNFTDNLKKHSTVPRMIRTEDELYENSIVTLDEFYN